VAAAAVAVFALAAGLLGTLVQARRATRAAAQAEVQRRRADVQRDFALRQLGHAEVINDLNAFLLSDAAPSGKPFTAGELLARAEGIANRKGADTDENLVTILIAIGRQYTVLDQHDKGRPLLEKAYAIARKLPDRSQGAKAACALATSVVHSGATERAETLVREGLAAVPSEPQYALDRVFCLLRGSEVSREAGDMKTGVKRAEEARDVLKESGLGSALLNLRVSMDVAESYRTAGRLREAGPAFEDALARLSALGRERTETAGTLLNNWALSVDLQGRHLEAESLYRRAVAISITEGSEKNVSPMLLNNLARSLRDLGRLREAADYADRAYAGAKETSNGTVVGQSLVIRASTYRLLGELDRAEKMIDEADALWKKSRSPAYSGFPSLASERAMVAQARGDLRTALLRTDEAMRLMEPIREQFPEQFARILGRRAKLELEMGRSKEAESDARAVLDVLTKVIEPGALSSIVGRNCVALGKALAAQGKIEAARAQFRAAVPHLSAALGADHPETAEARRLAA
jgi:tetratricopeptide (TPR) repeat protein